MSTKFGILNQLYRLVRDLERQPDPRTFARAEKLLDDSPDPARFFSPNALHGALSSPEPVVVIRPDDFAGGLALDYPPHELAEPQELKEYLSELRAVADDRGWSDVPSLWMYRGDVPDKDPLLPRSGLFVEGHEGRHRTGALAEVGEPEVLTRLFPTNYDRKGQPLAGDFARKLEDLRAGLRERWPVFGEDPRSDAVWPGGSDFPFLRWYRGGGQVVGGEYALRYGAQHR